MVTACGYFFQAPNPAVRDYRKELPLVRIRYDADVDALNVIIQGATVMAKEQADGIVASDAQARLAALEILDAGWCLASQSTFRATTLDGVGLAAPSGARKTRRSR